MTGPAIPAAPTSPERFVNYLGVPTDAEGRVVAPAGAPCRMCCQWALPLSAEYTGRQTAHGVGLHYVEWLVWHWHVQHHQQGVLVS